ncbi:LacI family DNA-binding transcriptional regulator [uncultured Sphaerochaeta sp.]|uniref:LacI family DNA-binding transcriptional regulator n=1 Tax=uncultured Sphaerochaeta sp. TaxID=886478 RepID=UPI002A0A1908|nr:LacI family DNA-binding transcriptional regulator [uncultured Sphaerochaeta sp.]
MGKKATLEQIAQQVGTSKITVSRALKGQSGVGDDLRQQIWQVASSLGYEHQRLRSNGRKLHIAFLVPKRFYLITDSFYHVIYYHLNILCNEQDLDLSLFIMEKDDEEQGRLVDGIEACDGIIVGGEVSRMAMQAVTKTARPYVVVDYDPMDDHSDCVIIDNYRIGAVLAEYLYQRGYGRIGFVGSLTQSSNIADRILGYRKILYTKHLTLQDEWLVDNYDKDTDNYLLDIRLPDPLPEAFICQCDRAAYYFMERLKSRGVQIPSQVAIVSIDNTEMAASTTPSLTSMSIDKRLFAIEALTLLQERRQGRTQVKRIYLDAQLVERDSAPKKERK